MFIGINQCDSIPWLGFFAFAEVVKQEGPGFSPFPCYRAFRQVQCLGGFLDAQATEKTAFHYLFQPGRMARKPMERGIQVHDAYIQHGLDERFLDQARWHIIGIPLGRCSPPTVVDKYVPNDAGRDGLQMPVVSELQFRVGFSQAQIGFMHQRSRLESQILPLSFSVPMRDLTQLCVNLLDQRIKGLIRFTS